jgi:hypothetical protein
MLGPNLCQAPAVAAWALTKARETARKGRSQPPKKLDRPHRMQNKHSPLPFTLGYRQIENVIKHVHRICQCHMRSFLVSS